MCVCVCLCLCVCVCAGREDGTVQAPGQGPNPGEGEHGGTQCQDQRPAPGLHLAAETGGICSGLRHGLCDTVGRQAHPRHL